MDRINEDSKHNVRVTFKDEDGRPYVPTTIHYRIDCDTTKQQVLGVTEFTPVGSSVTIPVTPSQNAIIKDANKRELKTMKVFADYGTDDQVTEVVQWYVRNLSGV
jgi:hypothetical protein